MIDKNKFECCGCSACVNVCGAHAISMKPDELGFLYPVINKDICINCGLCESACQFHPNYELNNNLDNPILYAARQIDKRQIIRSRSGGVFAALSDLILDRGGVVYGATFDNEFRVLHKRATTPDQRDEMRGSKYVQSDITGVFSLVKNDLNNQKFVLFTGTPCQVAGLKKFLRIKHVNCEKLLTCDIVCHGVPSPYIWRDYIRYIEKKYKSKVIKANFRDKRFGWKAHIESFVLVNSKSVYSTAYTDAFYKHIMFRHSCEVCPYTNFRRVGDITLADYWGVERIDDSINSDDLGVSLLMLNTPIGLKYFNDIKYQLNYIETTQNKCDQPNLHQPSVADNKRESFEIDYSQHGFKYTMTKYAFIGWKHNLNKFVLRFKTTCYHYLIWFYKHIMKRNNETNIR